MEILKSRARNIIYMQLIFVGFENREMQIYRNTRNFQNFEFICFIESNAAIKWLSEIDILQPKIMYAIFCKFNVMAKEDFSFAKEVNQSEYLKSTPIILIHHGFREEIKKYDASQLLKIGIDDLYTIHLKRYEGYLKPIGDENLYRFSATCQKIHSRIQFLHKYKPEMALITSKSKSIKSFKMPITKRVFDLVIAATLILILAPLLLLISILIKVDSKGPILDRFKRVGMCYDIFDLINFRIFKLEPLKMFSGKPKYNIASTYKNEEIEPSRCLTKVGRHLQRYRLDKLPQLFNIIMGNMSIVGNRALPLDQAEQMTVDGWSNRFLAPVGLIGFTQIHKRKSSVQEERIQMEVDYANDHSLRLDMKVILIYIRRFFLGKLCIKP